MSGKVLSTPEGKAAITKMQTIINGGLSEQIQNLIATGEQLGQPTVWDGQLASTFRSEWPNTAAALRKAKDDLEVLRGKIERINVNIMTAGGNA